MKYLVTRLASNDNSMPLNVQLFSDNLVHLDQVPSCHQVLGAGFCRMSPEGIKVEKQMSDSLKIGPHKADAVVITLFFCGQFEQQRMLLADHYDED